MIPVADPGAQNTRLQPELSAAITRVIDGNSYILGPELEALEAEFADFIGTRHAVGVANGTDAIALALRALGIGPGDEVVVPSLTAVATAAAVEMAGATPVLVDVRAADCTMDPQSVLQAFSERTRAVIPVHLYGRPADLDQLVPMCEEQGIPIIEDCSQAHGAAIRGTRVGAIGVIGAFSCYPTKNLGAIGDAGLLTTNRPELAATLQRLRQYGWETRNFSLEAGVNSRLDEVQAAILRVKLRHLAEFNHARARIAARYQEAFADLAITIPSQGEGITHAWHLYTIQTTHRDRLGELLRSRGVGTAIHYPYGVHQQPAYQSARRVQSLEVTAAVSASTLSLPLFPELSDADVDRVIDAVRAAVQELGDGIGGTRGA